MGSPWFRRYTAHQLTFEILSVWLTSFTDNYYILSTPTTLVKFVLHFVDSGVLDYWVRCKCSSYECK